MEKFKVTFTAENQQLKSNGIKHASDTYADIEATFILGTGWTDMDSVSAVWWNDFTKIATVLDGEGTCTVPHEVLTRKGCVRVNLVGSIVENGELVIRLTSYSAEAVQVNEKIKLTGSETSEITPSQYEQFAANVRADADRAEAAKDEARESATAASASATASSESAAASSNSATRASQASAAAEMFAQSASEASDEAEAARDAVLGMRATATTLPEGSDATASYSGGLLTLGIPRGDRGEQGIQGETGATPNLTIGTVETLAPTEDATATITGTPEEPVLNLGIPKGDTGEVSLADLEELLPVDTASGAIASFPDGQSVIPARSLKVALEPIQEGTPWIGTEDDTTPYISRQITENGNSQFDEVVGGTVAWNQLCDATKMKTSQTTDGVTFTNNNDGTFTLNGTAIASDWYICSPYPNTITVEGHKYFVSDANHNGVANQYGIGWSVNPSVILLNDTIARATGNNNTITYIYRDGAVINNAKFKPMCFDLTLMFGSTIADYIYSLETANAGAGVAFFKTLFPKPYYAYNAGELKSVKGLVSHDMIGFNAWDEEWEVGSIDGNTGENQAYSAYFRSKNYIPVFPSTSYYINSSGVGLYVYKYDSEYNFLGYASGQKDRVYTTSSDTHYIRFVDIATNKYDPSTAPICINLSWDGERDGEYEPYQKWSYPLDSDLELRGIPKIENGNLYYDGDVYESDGTVTRKYGIVDLGTLNWVAGFGGFYSSGLHDVAKSPTSYDVPVAVCSKYPWVVGGSGKTGFFIHTSTSYQGCVIIVDPAYTDAVTFKAAMSGVYLVYELDTPTTESADPYTNPQKNYIGGTEEYIGAEIPVGHRTRYADIFPISGHTSVNVIVSPTTDAEDGETYHTDLGQTVYGGTLDVVSGELVVDRAISVLSGASAESWSEYTGIYGFYHRVDDMAVGMALDGASDRFATLTRITSADTGFTFGQNNQFIYVSHITDTIDGVTDVSSWKAWLSQNPTTIVYPLATPQTYTLTAQQVELLMGTNNVWSDSGEVTVIYSADIQRWVEKKLA